VPSASVSPLIADFRVTTLVDVFGPPGRQEAVAAAAEVAEEFTMNVENVRAFLEAVVLDVREVEGIDAVLEAIAWIEERVLRLARPRLPLATAQDSRNGSIKSSH
jgi:hypothetical protein